MWRVVVRRVLYFAFAKRAHLYARGGPNLKGGLASQCPVPPLPPAAPDAHDDRQTVHIRRCDFIRAMDKLREEFDRGLVEKVDPRVLVRRIRERRVRAVPHRRVVRVVGDRELVRHRPIRAIVLLQPERHGLAPGHGLRELPLALHRHWLFGARRPPDEHLRAVDGAHALARVVALPVGAVAGEPLGVEAGVRHGAGDDAGGLVDEIHRKLAQVPQGHVLRGRLEFVIDHAAVRLRRRLFDGHAEVLRFTEPGSVLDAYLEGRFSVLIRLFLEEAHRVVRVDLVVYQVSELYNDALDRPAALGLDLHPNVAKPRHDEAATRGRRRRRRRRESSSPLGARRREADPANAHLVLDLVASRVERNDRVANLETWLRSGRRVAEIQVVVREAAVRLLQGDLLQEPCRRVLRERHGSVVLVNSVAAGVLIACVKPGNRDALCPHHARENVRRRAIVLEARGTAGYCQSLVRQSRVAERGASWTELRLDAIAVLADVEDLKLAEDYVRDRRFWWHVPRTAHI